MPSMSTSMRAILPDLTIFQQLILLVPQYWPNTYLLSSISPFLTFYLNASWLTKQQSMPSIQLFLRFLVVKLRTNSINLCLLSRFLMIVPFPTPEHPIMINEFIIIKSSIHSSANITNKINLNHCLEINQEPIKSVIVPFQQLVILELCGTGTTRILVISYLKMSKFEVEKQLGQLLASGWHYYYDKWLSNNIKLFIMGREKDDDDQSEEDQQKQQLQQKIEILRPKIDRIDKFTNMKKIIINVSMTQYPVVTQVAEELGWKIQQNNQSGDWDVYWTDFAIDPDILIKMHLFQKINHYPGMYVIARKNLLGLSLMSLRNKFPQQYNFFPLTWMLPQQYAQFRSYYETKPKGKTRTYIVKPEAQCQGRGIFLTRRIQDLQNGKHYVVQRYVARPFLLEGLKFDMRIYVLLCGLNPLRLYVYNQGLGRLATEQYTEPTSTNLQHQYIHLTNYAINKLNPKFIFNTNANNMGIGHKRSLSCIYKQLEQKGLNIKELKQRINDVIIKTIICGLPLMSHQYKCSQPQDYAGNLCFHLLGLDIMLNNLGEPLVLEVNHTPSFTTDTPLDQKIKFSLIKDTLVLMNINVKQKNQLFNRAKNISQERLFTGKRQIFQGRQREIAIQEAQKQRDEYENKNLGGFQKIYPSKDNQKMKKYRQIIDFSQKSYFQQNGSIRMKLEQKPPKQMQKAREKRIKKQVLGEPFQQNSRQLNSESLKYESAKRLSVQDIQVDDQSLCLFSESMIKHELNSLVLKHKASNGNDKYSQKGQVNVQDIKKSSADLQNKIYSRSKPTIQNQRRLQTPKKVEFKSSQRCQNNSIKRQIRQPKSINQPKNSEFPNIVDLAIIANSQSLSKREVSLTKIQRKPNVKTGKLYDYIAKDLRQMMTQKGQQNRGYVIPKLISIKIGDRRRINLEQQTPLRKGSSFNHKYDG